MGRTAYTKKDDENLVKYLANLGEGVGRNGKTIYQNLKSYPKKYPWAKRHPWQSWRERYIKNSESIDSKVERYLKEGNLDTDDEIPKPQSQRGAQKKFTEEEDILLVKFLAIHNPTLRGRNGNKVYEMLVAEENVKFWPWSKTHTWQSWRNRYIARQEHLDKAILKYQRKKGIDPSKPRDLPLPDRPAKRRKVEVEVKQEVEQDSQEDQWAQLHNKLAATGPQQTTTTDVDTNMEPEPTPAQIDVSQPKTGLRKHKDSDSDEYTDASDTEDSEPPGSEDYRNDIFKDMEEDELDELDPSEEEKAEAEADASVDEQDDEDEINDEEMIDELGEQTTHADMFMTDLTKEPDNDTPSTSMPQNSDNASPNVAHPPPQIVPIHNAPPTPPPETTTTHSSRPLKRQKPEVDEDPFEDSITRNGTPRIQSRKKNPPVINESTFGNRLSSKRNRIDDDSDEEEQEEWPPRRSQRQRLSTTRGELVKRPEEQQDGKGKGKARESDEDNWSETEDSATETPMPPKQQNSSSQVRPSKNSPKENGEERRNGTGKGKKKTQGINQGDEKREKVVVKNHLNQRVDEANEDDPMDSSQRRSMKGKDKVHDSFHANAKAKRPSLTETEVSDLADEDQQQPPIENTQEPTKTLMFKYPKRKTDIFTQSEFGPTPPLFKRHSVGSVGSSSHYTNTRLSLHDSNPVHSQNVSRTINLRKELANQQQRSLSRLSITTTTKSIPEQSMASKREQEEEENYVNEMGKQQVSETLAAEFGVHKNVVRRIWDKLQSLKAAKEELAKMKVFVERRMSEISGLPLDMGSEGNQTYTPIPMSSSFHSSSSRMSLVPNSSFNVMNSQSGEKIGRKRKRVSDVSDVSMINESGGGHRRISLEIRPINNEDAEMDIVYEPPRGSRAGKFARLVKMGRDDEALMREQKRVGYLALSPKRTWVQGEEQREQQEGYMSDEGEAEAGEDQQEEQEGEVVVVVAAEEVAEEEVAEKGEEDEEDELIDDEDKNSDSGDTDTSMETETPQHKSRKEHKQESREGMKVDNSQGRANVNAGVKRESNATDMQTVAQADEKSVSDDEEIENESGEDENVMVDHSGHNMNIDSPALVMRHHQQQSLEASDDDNNSTLDSEQDDDNSRLKIEESKHILKIESSPEIDFKSLEIRETKDADESDSVKDMEEVEALVRNGTNQMGWEEVELRFWSANEQHGDILRAAARAYSPGFLMKNVFARVRPVA